MILSNLLLALLLSAINAWARPEPQPDISGSAAATAAAVTCKDISSHISSKSSVIYALNPNFENDIKHWFLTSTQTPACVLQVGSEEDVATALKIIAARKTPFAVKSGGHTSNPGFSSTTGVHISFTNLQQVKVSLDKKTVRIGMGETWYGVYQKLASSGVNVVGGRTQGPGVGGFTLGGGYSWKTNQHGLTCDNVKSFNLVLPNGTATVVDSSTPDLFFALKGGLNRFGVVTSAEYYAYPQSPMVYGGSGVYVGDAAKQVVNATAAFFKENTSPKAQIISTFGGSPTGPTALVLFFNDGPDKPDSFKLFDSIAGINTSKKQTFADFVAGFPSQLALNARGTFNTLSTSRLTERFVNAVYNESDYWGKQMLAHSGTFVSYDVEPFDTSYGKYATDSAYPHANSPLPLNLYYAWVSPTDDTFWYAALEASIANLKRIAIEEGIYSRDLLSYPNYAITDTPLAEMYGKKNLARLRQIKKSVDPENIMGLAGGFPI